MKGVAGTGHEEKWGRGGGGGREKTDENAREVVAVDVGHPIDKPPSA